MVCRTSVFCARRCSPLCIIADRADSQCFVTFLQFFIIESAVYPTPPYDDTLVDRFTDPGAGAFTYSRGRQFTVSRPLTGK